METTEVTLVVRGETSPDEVIAVVGSCEALGNWIHQHAVTLDQCDDRNTWTKTITVPRGVELKYRYFKGFFAKSLGEDGDRQVVVNVWETHLYPRKMSLTESHVDIDDGEFGIHDGVNCVDSGWLTCQAEVRLRLYYSNMPPVSTTKKKFSDSQIKTKLPLGDIDEEKDEDEDELSPSSLKMPTTLEIRMITADGYESSNSQPECGCALEPSQWTEYIIRTMDPDNLEVTFEFFEDDVNLYILSRGYTQPGLVGTACLLSSSFLESGKDYGVVTLPIIAQNSRETIGKVRVDYLVIRPIQGLQYDMSSSFTKYWKKRNPLNVGHRGTGRTHAAWHQRIRENTIEAFKTAAKHGAAYVEFDVHLSKDEVPIVYHDLTCVACTKKKNDRTMEFIEMPVKDLTFEQLQCLKLGTTGKDPKDMLQDDDRTAERQPFPTLTQIFQAVPGYVGFNIEIKWISQMKNGSWDGNVSSYFNMNTFLDIILSCVLQNAGKRRIIFSSFNADICSMVRRKQNKYPILFLTQGISDRYPEMMDLRCQSTQFAVRFAQSENILGISAHTEELLKNLNYIEEAQSKGLVVFSWGDDNDDHETRNKQRDHRIDGLIYDRICEARRQQKNIFQLEDPQDETGGNTTYCSIS